MIFQKKVKVIRNIKVVQGTYKMILSSAQIAKAAEPGQFIQIKISQGPQPLLRRPFSIHRVRDARIEILYAVVGPGTEILSKRKSGEYLDILGPLGNGFSYHLALSNYRLPILVAGGMGTAPLLFLAECIRNDYPKFDIQVLIGTKKKQQILCGKEFKKLGCDVTISTDDGSRGFKGKVTQLLQGILQAHKRTMTQGHIVLYACGPRPMLKEIARISKTYKIPAQISLEEHMACGIGACLGCVVKTKDGFQRVCKEGPVFNAEEIIWQEGG